MQSEPQVLTDFLRRIHPRAPKARVLVVTYQQIIPSSGATCAGVQLTAEHAHFEHDVGQRLQEAFQRAAAHSEAQVVDTYAPSANHNACATTDPWVSAWTWGFFPTGTIAFHPTIEGMTAAADQIVARLRP